MLLVLSTPSVLNVGVEAAAGPLGLGWSDGRFEVMAGGSSLNGQTIEVLCDKRAC